MEIVLFTILLFVCALSLIEDRLQKYNRGIYITLTVVLILFAGLREVGFDRDSENYEYYFNNYDDPVLEFAVEFSYRLLSYFLHLFSDDVHTIFLFYAIIGISLKLFAFRRLTNFLYLPIAVYLANYYVLHDLTQIRASIASGLMLFTIPYIGDNRKKVAMCLLLLAVMFHYSAIVLLPLIFLKNTDLSVKERWIWAALIPIGYFMYFIQVNIATFIYVPYVSDKIDIYNDLRNKGLVGDEINVFYWVFILKCFVYMYVLYFYDTIKQQTKFLPLVIKIMGVSLFLYLFLAQMPILSFRLSELFGISEILMFTYISYTINPQWLGKCVVCIISVTLSALYIFIEKIFESV